MILLFETGMKMKIFSINTELDKVTGVQKVLVDIHCAVKDKYVAKIVSQLSYRQIDSNLRIQEEEYICWRNPFLFYNSLVFVHERKVLLILWLLNTLLFQRIKIIYIHHNILRGWRWVPMPKCVVAISDRCLDNLLNYFNLNPRHIHKIYNCVNDIHPFSHKYKEGLEIKVLYPARINGVKRQIEIVNYLKGRLSPYVKILFAGTGPSYEELNNITKENSQFITLGFRNDILQLFQQCDYVLLFSEHEGLPITLIEATMCGTPIVCNDVGGNCEIAYDGENAIVVNEWEKLIETLNKLPEISEVEYRRMSNASRNIYEKNFTFEAFKQNYLNLLNEL